LRRKLQGFLCGVLILFYGFFACRFQGMMPPGGHPAIAREALKINFPATLGTLKAQIFSSLEGYSPTTAKDIIVDTVLETKVIPGGQSIGVLLHSQGVLVTGFTDLTDGSGKKPSPALEAGILCGDVILKVENCSVNSDEQLRELVDRVGREGRPLTVEVKRGNNVFVTKIKPVFSKETSGYRIGLMIRDSAAGVGTLTFYEPSSMIYGALGHLVTDAGTPYPVELSDGRIIGASIQDIRKGKRGQPGEKIGMFQEEITGTISKNTKMGIFGLLNKLPENNGYGEPIPVAGMDQIYEGAAEILTVLQGDKVEKFSIEILKINPQARADGKGLVIKITDQRLLDRTGGIVQGMSGSPIIQDNRLVGAVTHVFVNDPTKGFGVPAEWMLRESEIIQIKNVEKVLKMAC